MIATHIEWFLVHLGTTKENANNTTTQQQQYKKTFLSEWEIHLGNDWVKYFVTKMITRREKERWARESERECVYMHINYVIELRVNTISLLWDFFLLLLTTLLFHWEQYFILRWLFVNSSIWGVPSLAMKWMYKKSIICFIQLIFFLLNLHPIVYGIYNYFGDYVGTETTVEWNLPLLLLRELKPDQWNQM